jgi:hypothetical protein
MEAAVYLSYASMAVGGGGFHFFSWKSGAPSKPGYSSALLVLILCTVVLMRVAVAGSRPNHLLSAGKPHRGLPSEVSLLPLRAFGFLSPAAPLSEQQPTKTYKANKMLRRAGLGALRCFECLKTLFILKACSQDVAPRRTWGVAVFRVPQNPVHPESL